MLVELEGGCRVVGLKDGEPVRDGDLLTWQHFSSALSLRVLELRGRATFHNEAHDEVLYILGEERSIYLPAGESLELSGEMTIVSALAPQAGTPASQPAGTPALQRTGDRWYSELIQAEVTQFIGGIPPGRAPDHFHLYEEVICILDGSGIMHAGSSSTAITKGSCIFLPRRQVHCVENTGSGELRLLGVFYPAGSPAVRYGASSNTTAPPSR
ncbi:MAG: cupin domain-containing protein [Acidobacteriota bacterium]